MPAFNARITAGELFDQQRERLQLRWFAWAYAHWLRLKEHMLLRVRASWPWRLARVWRRGVQRRWQAWRAR